LVTCAATHCYRFAMPPTQMCDADGLLAAYQAPQPFTRDGLLFVAKDGNYELGVTPLAMLWKDNACSQYVLAGLHSVLGVRVITRTILAVINCCSDCKITCEKCQPYVLDTNQDGSTPERQKVVLALKADTGDVVTGDPQPVSLARLPAAFLASAGRVATAGLYKFNAVVTLRLKAPGFNPCT
jgi:snurportin-1